MNSFISTKRELDNALYFLNKAREEDRSTDISDYRRNITGDTIKKTLNILTNNSGEVILKLHDDLKSSVCDGMVQFLLKNNNRIDIPVSQNERGEIEAIQKNVGSSTLC